MILGYRSSQAAGLRVCSRGLEVRAYGFRVSGLRKVLLEP